MTTPIYERLAHSRIREPEDPSRLDIDKLKLNDLADDIARNGLLQPIGVRGPMPDGFYDIGYGHRRFLAVGLLGWPAIDAKVFPPGVDLRQIRASENHQREPLTPIEEARELRRFMVDGEPLAVAARRYRKGVVWAQERLALLDYPADIQEAVHAGQLKLGVAASLAQIEHDGVRADYVREAQRVGATSATAALWLQHWKTEGARMAANHAAVEEIVLRRSAFVYYVPCDLCGDPTDFGRTRAIRTCPECTAALDALVERTKAEAAGSTLERERP